MKSVFLVFFQPGLRWVPGLESPQQPGFRVHADYLNAVDKRHRLLIGGPLDDYSAILLAMEAENEAQVRDLLARDPWLLDGMLVIERIRKWTLLVDPRAQ